MPSEHELRYLFTMRRRTEPFGAATCPDSLSDCGILPTVDAQIILIGANASCQTVPTLSDRLSDLGGRLAHDVEGSANSEGLAAHA